MSVGLPQDQTQDPPNSSGRNWRGIRFRRRLDEEDRTEAAAIEPTDDGNGRPAETFDPCELDSEGVAERLRLTCDTSEEPVLFEVDAIIEWPTPARVNLFRFIAYLDQPYRIRAEGSDEEFPDVFAFVLMQMADATDVARCQAGRQAALEAAAVLHPAALVPACNRIVGRLRELRVRGVHTEDVLREARAMAESLQTDADVEELVRVQDELPGVPTSADLVVPPGWSLSSDGLSRGYGTALALPVVLTGRLIGEDGREFLELAFQRDGRWEVRGIPRERIATARGILSLARLGLPVHAMNARQLVEYFAAFETANRDFLPVRQVVDRMGWHNVSGVDVFVVGETVIAPEQRADGGELALDDDELNPAELVVLRPRTPGDSDLANAMRTSGTYDAWRDAVSVIGQYPRAKLAFYAALTPAVLPIVGAPSFCLDYSGPTSSGKTTALRIAAACWGSPDESASTILLNWDSTPAFRQHAARMLGNLPLIVDETRLAGSNDEVVEMVYSVVAGRGRGRGSQAGTGLRGNWVTVLITSGETPLTSMTNKGGARARTFSIWGSPFGATNNNTAAMVGALNRGLHANYGHAGPALVRHLVRYRNMWDPWRQEYLDRVAVLEQRAGDDPVKGSIEIRREHNCTGFGKQNPRGNA